VRQAWVRVAPPEQPSSLIRGIALAAFFFAGCSPCNDGLGRVDWEARERVRAAASLPRARQLLTAALDSAWSAARPRIVTDQFRSPPDEAFDLGGLYSWGGSPLYGHSCSDPTEFSSSFRLRHVYAALTPDSLVILSGTATATDTTNPAASKIRPLVERRALYLREVTDAGLSVVDPPPGPAVVRTIVSATTGKAVSPPLEEPRRAFVFLRCTTSSALRQATLPVALEDSGTGRVFAAHLVAAARRLQGNK